MKLTTIKIRPQRLERWKMIKGYEGLYMVSDLGRVKSLERKISNGKGFRIVEKKILKPGINRGYLQVDLYKNGKGKMFKVHRLVANAFISNPLNKETVNHKNEIKTDNRVSNLEWMTREENNNYGTRNERGAKALSIPVVGINIDNREIIELNSVSQGKEFGFTPTNITQCCKGKLKSHKGYKWYYKEEYEKEQEISLDLLIMDNIIISY